MRKPLTLVLASIALVAVIVDAVLYRMARQFYTREAMVRLHPLGVASFTESGPPSLPPVLLLGDSRVAQWTDFCAGSRACIQCGGEW